MGNYARCIAYHDLYSLQVYVSVHNMGEPCSCNCAYVCMRTCVCVYVCVCVCAYLYICVCVWVCALLRCVKMCMHLCMHVYLCMYVFAHAHGSVWVHYGMCAYEYLCAQVYKIHIYISMFWWLRQAQLQNRTWAQWKAFTLYWPGSLHPIPWLSLW